MRHLGDSVLVWGLMGCSSISLNARSSLQKPSDFYVSPYQALQNTARNNQPIGRRTDCLFASLIMADSPQILTNFCWKWFSFLWRGKRDAFEAIEFHFQCESKANSLTVIVDVKNNPKPEPKQPPSGSSRCPHIKNIALFHRRNNSSIFQL
jgi:hypothetical protein